MRELPILTARGLRPLCLGLVAALAAAASGAAGAWAAFPYGGHERPPDDYTQYRIDAGENKAANEIAGGLTFKFAATPEPGNDPVNSNPYELNGVRGPSTADQADVDQAWRTTTGRPDVTIATLDSGIEWNDEGAMRDLRKKTRISRGEAPKPNRARLGGPSLENGVECADFEDPESTPAGDYDLNDDGVFNVVDYACDDRVERDPAKRAARGQPRGVGPADMLDPQDVLIAFTDGDDDDANGFTDDMVGWDFLDDDNDPYDDVQYGHGTGEAEDGWGEADNGGAVSHCPNCMGIHMRVGDSFIADVNRFAQAVVYAVDNDVLVVQEALGTLNHSKLGLDAVRYAYDHGVTVIASAADEAAQHHNWPSSYPHVVMVNSVTKPAEGAIPRSYLQFNGCTNFMANVTLAIPSTSCSSDAVGQASGMAGLIYSAALNRHERDDALANHPSCRRANGEPCVISANEVRQLMASGTVGGEQQSDDVDFLSNGRPGGDDGPGCNPPQPLCSDPNDPAKVSLIAAHRPLFQALPPNTRSYTARKGHDQFYGYGRVNTNRAVDALDAKRIPPEVEIRSPNEWWNQIDPSRTSIPVRGDIGIREGKYTCEVFVAPGSYPDNDTGAEGDFKKVGGGFCDGSTPRDRITGGLLATVPMSQLKSLFPPNAQGFDGREPGKGTEQTSNGRPNTEPYGFTIKVVARGTVSQARVTGEDRRNLYLHRDQDMLPSFPKKLPSDGAASPLFVDLDGDNRNELVLATSDGDVHAYRRDGSELPGWPVRGDPAPIHTGGRAFKSGKVDAARGAIIASPAAADLDRDGVPEVVAADLEGKVYAWRANGSLLFKRQTNLDYSGRPLSPFVDVRKGKKYRTQRGFIASPVLADIDRDDGGALEVVAAAMDRHVYAWDHDGKPVPGFPTLVIDYSKLEGERVDPQTHAPDFRDDVGNLNQGAIIDTPAVGDIAGDARPEIVVGTNEEYTPGQGGEPPLNMSQLSTYSAASPLLDPANSRLYAIKPDGDADGPRTGPAPYVDGWPVPIAFLLSEILPVVGEGITGAPAIAPVDCPEGGDGAKVGAMSAAGPAYVLNADGSSCYGTEPDQDGNDRHRTADTEQEGPAGSAERPVTDKPAIPAFGHPTFGNLGPDGGPVDVNLLAPAAGLIRALDVAANEYQVGGQDQLAAWDARTGVHRPRWPMAMNDLQFLTGPSVGEIDGQTPTQEVVAGSASLDLQAYTAAGERVGGAAVNRWPKLTSDWMVANPLLGSFDTLETAGDARRSVVAVTRSGLVHAYGTDVKACSPASWPRFHHDNANSGDLRRDAAAPGKPTDLRLDAGRVSFSSPGDDLLCGTPAFYEVSYGSSEAGAIGGDFRRAEGDPVRAGSRASVPAADGARSRGAGSRLRATGFVAVRAVDEQGNRGRAAATSLGQAGDGGDDQAGGRGSGEGGGQESGDGGDQDGDDGGGGEDGGRGRPAGNGSDRREGGADVRGGAAPGSATRGSDGSGEGVLPFTGLALGGLALLAGLLLVGGALLRRSGRSVRD